ncbi:CG13008 [Drosophila busckii]|uniref:CG13008 n=1 Tax=Drosophila busckii TaxID=30019 RepID=A0A0M4F900_DROBS|nr:uncharacterized protein LOC108607091 [Drosophila busckii]ALC48950.1 CG13008 [Drosophila busckii]
MLKIHDLYGQSYAHEFQFTNPDSIKNAVRRYNDARAAERNEGKKDREPAKSLKPRFCKIRNTGNDVMGMVTSRDRDVETQVSLEATPLDANQLGSPSVSGHSTERLCGGADLDRTVTEGGAVGGKRKRKQRRGLTKREQKQQQHVLQQQLLVQQQQLQQLQQQQQYQTEYNQLMYPDGYASHIEGLHREVCNELRLMGAPLSDLKMPQELTRKPEPKPKPKPSQQSKQPKQPVQPPKQLVQPPPKQAKAKSKPETARKAIRAKHVSYEDCPQPLAQWADIIPSPMTPQLIHVNLCEALNPTPSAACLFMRQHGSQEPEPIDPFFVEDSDLEHEYAQRPTYLRYIEPRRPYCHNNSGADGDNDVDVVERQPLRKPPPQFMGADSPPYWISMQPMQYTSQVSEPEANTIAAIPSPPRAATPHTEQQIKRRKPIPAPKPKPKAKPQPQQQQQQQAREPAGVERDQLTRTPSPPPTAVASQSNRRRRPRTLICTKSLENLKYEKLTIYNKISCTQERIISALDRLQASLLQLQVPACSGQEQQRRERNAFEFCVRFSRNFLYPLRGMIEDIRNTPMDTFNSANSNEACQRVVCVYMLIRHSIGRYQRQLRYFLLDKVPQKLSALIEMMYALTNVCLEKGVLDRQDPVVECLQQRCTSFLTFIEDMQQERFQLAQQNYRRLQKRTHGTVPGPSKHERYDLKMCLNDLKIYEPRLVPKERVDKRRQRTGWVRKHKCPIPANAAQTLPSLVLDQASELQMETPVEVPTHIECIKCPEYRGEPSSEPEPAAEESEEQREQLTTILALLRQPGRKSRQLHQNLLEAMQHVTKSQMREVLDPLLRSLGNMLDKKSKLNEE